MPGGRDRREHLAMIRPGTVRGWFRGDAGSLQERTMRDVKIKRQAIAKAESSLVRQVRMRESVSRVELARDLKLAPSTVGVYVDRLIKEQVLQEGRKAQRAAGRPRTILELNPEAGDFIGVDFDARQMVIVAVDFAQQIQQQTVQRLLVSDTATQVMKKIEVAIAAMSRGRRVLGIGVAVPGTIDSQRGVAVHYAYIRGWKNVPLVERLSQRFRVPIQLENNIRAMALAEQWFGEAQGVDHFVCLGIRSGIGAGIVINGQLHRGQDDLAGEIGGWPCEAGCGSCESFEPQGRTPSATRVRRQGEFATLEEVASVRSILNQLTVAVRAGTPTCLALKRNQVTLDEMLRGAIDSDPLVLKVLDRAAQAVGRVISQISLLLNPNKVIIAGPLTQLTDAFLQPVAKVVNEWITPLHAKVPHVVASQFGSHGGALGAAALAVHQWKPSR